jgi:hypothetical protein
MLEMSNQIAIIRKKRLCSVAEKIREEASATYDEIKCFQDVDFKKMEVEELEDSIREMDSVITGVRMARLVGEIPTFIHALEIWANNHPQYGLRLKGLSESLELDNPNSQYNRHIRMIQHRLRAGVKASMTDHIMLDGAELLFSMVQQ